MPAPLAAAGVTGRPSPGQAERVAAYEDQPRPDEPDAGDDLGGGPGRVHDHLASAQHVTEAVLADQHEQGGADSDQAVGAQPALFCLTSRSSPMTADSSRPRPSSPT